MYGELWPWSPTPGQSEKESLLIGSLAVFFTLNIKVEQKSQASVLAEEGSAFSSPVCPWRPRATSPLSRDSLPSLLPSATRPGAGGPRWEPPLLAQLGHMSPSPPRCPSPLPSQQVSGRGETPIPKFQLLPPTQYCFLDYKIKYKPSESSSPGSPWQHQD